ncbi:MAG TPA: hypothetical protein VHF90_04145 [Thermoleophilaceae bacterium]|nr:hypothetical protein [Thermoleophilaceae bacterium]
MAVSRPLLIVLIAAVLGLVAFYATQGSRDSSETAAPPVAPAVPARTADMPQTSRPSAADRRRARAERRGMPLAVARALRARKTVVLFFRGSPSADDRATARAVSGLRGQPGVTVFADRIGKLGRYRAIVGDLGIAQAPAVVIVGRGRAARVVEGYIDPTTLAQDVADAR